MWFLLVIIMILIRFVIALFVVRNICLGVFVVYSSVVMMSSSMRVVLRLWSVSIRLIVTMFMGNIMGMSMCIYWLSRVCL